jgi:hypothetical protein
MKKIIVITLILMLGYTYTVSAQGFQPPAEGKAVIYFTRVTSYGFAVAFDFFVNDKCIGAFKGENYMRYELDEGEYLIWASSENREFVPSTLKAGDTYIVIVDVKMGKKQAIIGLTPIDINNTDLFNRAKKLIMKKKPFEIKDKDVEKLNNRFASFIQENINLYETQLKDESALSRITPEKAIPLENQK